MRIPKLSHIAKRLQNARLSPSITWDYPLILPKPAPSCSTGGTNANSSSINTAVQNIAVGSLPKKKKKRKKKNKPASQESDSITSSNSGLGLTGKKPQGTKKKQQKGVFSKEARGKNQGIVIRDTSPKFIPPEKTKKPPRCQSGRSMVSVEPMEVSQPAPCSSTVTEQHHTNFPPSGKIAQRPSVFGSNDPVSNIRDSLTEFARTLPTPHSKSSRPVQQPREPRKSSSTEPPMEPKSGPCTTESTRWSPIFPRSFKPAQQPQPSQVCEQRKLSSSVPHVKETQPRGRPLTSPPPGSFKPLQQPTEVSKSSSGEPPVRDTQSKSRPFAAIPLSKSLNRTKPPPHKAALGNCSAAGDVSEASWAEDSEKPGFVLRLPPSRVKGGSLLFGDVIEIEGRAENQSVEMMTEHQKELGKKVGGGMQPEPPALPSAPSGNRITSQNVSTVPNSHRTGAGNGSAVPSSQTNGSAIINRARSTQRDAATTQQKSGVRANSKTKCGVQATTQPAPAEGSGRTLPISRISSDGYRGPHSMRPRSSSLPAEDSSGPAVSGGQKRPRSTSSSTEVAPPIPKQSHASVKCE
ncbi:hypothetical protein GBAR_LOCUS28375, partial [Geodia barretti]